jgi:hypothetical protein
LLDSKCCGKLLLYGVLFLLKKTESATEPNGKVEERVTTLNRKAKVFFVEAIILCIVASFRFVNLQSTVTLIIFNLFFISLFFQLHGSPTLKVGMLTAGNILGLFWNLFFYYFSLAGYEYFGVSFNAFFTLIYPILNLMWIVPFWSLSLSFLPKLQFPKTT